VAEVAILIGLQASGKTTFYHAAGMPATVRSSPAPSGRSRSPCVDGSLRKLRSRDSRIWLGTSTGDMIDYFSWRQSDATRCALNGWCYWTLRKAGASRQEATRRLDGTTPADKNELLFGHGINFNELPTWQRRGIGLWWETHGHTGHDPVRGVDVTTTRRRVHVERELPMKDGYRALVDRLVSQEAL
jgi:tRNA(His) 5'-end guanylyltransferase